MAGFRPTQINPPSDETEFEKNCVVLFQELLSDPNVKRLGRRGQGQHGIDIVGHRNRDAAQLVGIQCKLKSLGRKLTAREVREEVKAAVAYQPALSEYFIVTTAKDDTKLDQLAQQLMLDQAAAGRRIDIKVWGWITLQEKIDQFESTKRAFDPGYSPSLASHDRKLDGLLAQQGRLATKGQVAALAESIQRASATISAQLPQPFADRELQTVLGRTLRRRGFGPTDTRAELAALATRAISGDLASASNIIRAEVCDRAARSNASADNLEKARAFRDQAARLDPSRDLLIAGAALKEADGDGDGALRDLRGRADADTRSALFLSVVRQRGRAAALSWVREEGLRPADLNCVGAMNVVLGGIEGGAFADALESLSNTPTDYFDQCPALRLLRAQLVLSSVLPEDQKGAVLQGLPMNPRILQLTSGTVGQDAIRSAEDDIRVLLGLLDELELQNLRPFLSEFHLWLRLEDVSTRDAARRQLATEISDPAQTLRRVRLALAYEIPFNVDALQRNLTARNEVGGWTPDERFAAFLIVYHSGKAARIIDFFEKYHSDLFAQSDLVRSSLAGIEIEVYARTGRFEEARQHIASHKSAGDLTQEQAHDLGEAVAHIEKGDEAEALRQRYETSPSLGNLRQLVAALRTRRDFHQLATYAPPLARQTKAIEDFDLAMKSLFQSKRYDEVLALTDELKELFEQDDEYNAIKGWTLFRLGRVVEARAIARTLVSRRDVAADRELTVNTAIETGDWGNLQATLAREAERADTLPVSDLTRLARLALEAGSLYVDHFRDAALRKAPDDPKVNLLAYVLDTERGREYRGAQAHQWFENAARLSGPEGPVQSMSMKQIFDRAPRWNEHVEKIELGIRNAELPLFMASKGLNRQLLDMMLGQALRNSDPDDPRPRYPVFAFSGAQAAQDLTSAKSIAVDITCLITLDFLGLLEKVQTHFERIVLAPTTLSHFFIERQFLKIQQPSQMAKAERIQALIATGALKVISGEPDTTLTPFAKDAGRDLATLLTVAQRNGGLVVRSAPVAKLGSFLEESVDMAAFAETLTDTLAVLSVLSDAAKIDADVRRGAEGYLRKVDKGWPSAKSITSESTLYLDDLTVTYLDYVGLLGPLTRSVAGVFVHPDVQQRVRDTLRYGKHVEDLLAAIDRIREALRPGIESGRVSFSSRHTQDEKSADEDAEDEIDGMDLSPTIDLMSNLSGIDAVVVDDRCLNKLATWTDASQRNAVVGSSLDILRALKAVGGVTSDDYFRLRHKLRGAGYYAMPLEVGELEHHLAAAPINDKKIGETPELMAARESIALPKINRCFIASEAPWLNGIRFAVFKAIRDSWLDKAVTSDAAAARADWLVSILPEPRTWCVTPENEAVWAATRNQAAIQLCLLLVFIDGSEERRKQYYAWLDERVVKPLKKNHPELWDTAMEFLGGYIQRLLEGPDAA